MNFSSTSPCYNPIISQKTYNILMALQCYKTPLSKKEEKKSHNKTLLLLFPLGFFRWDKSIETYQMNYFTNLRLFNNFCGPRMPWCGQNLLLKHRTTMLFLSFSFLKPKISIIPFIAIFLNYLLQIMESLSIHSEHRHVLR